MQRRRNEAYENSDGIGLPQGFQDDGIPPRKVKVEERQRSGNNRRRRTLDSSEYGNSNSNTNTNTNNTKWMILFTIFMAIILVASYFLISDHEEKQIQHAKDAIMHEKVEPMTKDWEERYARLQEENKRLRQEHEKDIGSIKESENFAELEKQSEMDRKQIQYFKTYQKKIHDRIKKMSHTMLLEKYGSGPHHVQIDLAFVPEFPKKEAEDSDRQTIVIEMAPIEEMPHVVFFFLEQVTHGLYDGCSFHRNAGHVIQGGPSPNFLSPPDPKLHKRFSDAGFYSVLYQEYSPNFTHQKYTLGLAGRPGGPDFYISTKDNSRLHGPGGQVSYDDPSEADPCFAKVIEGYEVVDRMQLGPVQPGGYKAFTNNVAILSMKLLEL